MEVEQEFICFGLQDRGLNDQCCLEEQQGFEARRLLERRVVTKKQQRGRPLPSCLYSSTWPQKTGAGSSGFFFLLPRLDLRG